MSETETIKIEKFSQTVNLSYPTTPMSEECVVFFEEDPHWYRRRKLLSTARCDVYFIYVQNSPWSGLEEISKAAALVAERPYKSIASISYGSSAFPMMTFSAIVNPEYLGVISPTLHENSFEFIEAAQKVSMPNYEREELRTYLLHNEEAANRTILKNLGPGGGWSREVSLEQSEKLRKESKTARFVEELASDKMRALDACFERIVFGEM
ncbi:hypothetical protein DL1_20500 [Thioclava dalianensis]|uniref:Uncharacterized protein n=1 Tax=Thioclava dalianensis TaxID=1185766 RepID=A0A074TLW7_9RHOB|nr:hypothetical protein [Thioclava dalianensis]KEP69988.1 hypothetical protein DL1_20500 [Thioclava dalianensis]SFN16625.1 hypothetical protein SAMN05216224_102748 [Thioclava dalianensis]